MTARTITPIPVTGAHGFDMGHIVRRHHFILTRTIISGQIEDVDVAPTPPTITLVSPPEGQLDSESTIVIDVTDSDGFATIRLDFEIPSRDVYDVVWNGVEFVGKYTNSTREQIDDTYRFHIRRNAGWPALDVKIHGDAVDSLGAGA